MRPKIIRDPGRPRTGQLSAGNPFLWPKRNQPPANHKLNAINVRIHCCSQCPYLREQPRLAPRSPCPRMADSQKHAREPAVAEQAMEPQVVLLTAQERTALATTDPG